MNDQLQLRPRWRLARIPTVVVAALLLTLLVLQGLPAAVQGSAGLPGPTTTRRPAAASHDAEAATAWFDLALELVQETPGYTPPVASRAFGLLGVTVYETVRPGMPGYRTLAGQLNDLPALPRTPGWPRFHWPAAANAALASLTRQLFPTATPANLAAIDALEDKLAAHYQAQVDATTYRRSVIWGRTVADAIYTWSRSDGGHEGYTRNFPTDYVPPSGPGLWEPTPPQFSPALQPYWGDNRPFVLANGDACPAPEPPVYSEAPDSAFYAEAHEVYTVVRNADPSQAAIAAFWADDPGQTATPPGHWVAILNQVLVAEDADLALASESYAKVGIAVSDAFITCWRTKFIYNVPRPITYIQQVIDPRWNTPEVTDPVTTPPFPEYTSGHSVQSAAAAAVLGDLFGADYAFTDATHVARGLPPRTYPSFAAAAEEAAISRLYGGIHYRSAIENGLAQGECVAERVLALRFGPATGAAALGH